MNERIRKRTILIGSVDSSAVVLEEMIADGFPLEMVFSLDEAFSDNVSGYCSLDAIAKNAGIPCTCFRKINDMENVRIIREIDPDFIFVVGLSQLVSKEIIGAAKQGVIGFHPTPLPKYRGRAAIVWQILLGVRHTKCSMFFIDDGIDSGDIIAQDDYYIDENDYASDVGKKLLTAMRPLTRNVLNQIKSGKISRTKQNEADAVYLLKRTPDDGRINWEKPVQEIWTLIRAVSHPYPGAFSLYDGKNRVIMWRAEVIYSNRYIGIPGQIAKQEGNSIFIVCNGGLLRVYDYDNCNGAALIAGHKFM